VLCNASYGRPVSCHNISYYGKTDVMIGVVCSLKQTNEKQVLKTANKRNIKRYLDMRMPEKLWLCTGE